MSEIDVDPRASYAGASTTGGSEAGSSSLSDHLPLEFGDRGDHMKGEATRRSARVDPVVERHEVDAAGMKLVEGEYEMPDAARETVEPNHGHEIDAAPVNLRHHAVQLRASVLRSRLRSIDELPHDVPPSLLSRTPKLVQLRLWVLVGRAGSAVERNPSGPRSCSGTHPFRYVRRPG